jgi:hypothetical protein
MVPRYYCLLNKVSSMISGRLYFRQTQNGNLIGEFPATQDIGPAPNTISRSCATIPAHANPSRKNGIQLRKPNPPQTK